MKEQLEEIEALFAPQNNKDALLAMILSKNLESKYHDHWEKVLNAIGIAYWNLEKHSYDDPMAFNAFQNMTIQLVKKLLPAFQEVKKEFLIGQFFYKHLGNKKSFNYEPNEYKILALEKFLQKELKTENLGTL